MALAETLLDQGQSGLFPSSPLTGPTITWVSGRLYLVEATNFTGGGELSAVDIGGNATTLIGKNASTSGSNFGAGAWEWRPGSSGSGDVVFTFPSGSVSVVWRVTEVTGHNNTTPIVASATVTGNSNSPGSTISAAMPDRAASGNLRRFLIANGQGGDNSGTPTSGWTELADTSGGGQHWFYVQEGATNTDPSVTLAGTPNSGAAWVGYEIAEAASGVTSTGAATAPAPIAAATGLVGMTGTATATAPAPIAAATAVETITSTGAPLLPAPIAAATCVNALTSTGAGLFTAPVALASGVETITSSSAAQFPTLTALATALETITSTAAATLSATAAATGVVNLPANTQLVVGDGTSFVGYAMVGSTTASSDISSTAAASLTAPIAAATAVETLTSSAEAQVPAPVAAATGFETIATTAAATAPTPIGSAIGTIGSGDVTGTAAATIPAPTATASGTVGSIITSSATASLTAPIAAAAVIETITSTAAASVPFPVALAAILNVNNAIRIGGVSVTSSLSFGASRVSIPGDIVIGKVSTD